MRVLLIRTFLIAQVLVICKGLYYPGNPYIQGNKPRTAPRISKNRINHGECSAFVTEWKVWNGGFSGKILVHDSVDPFVSTWKASFELDKSAISLHSYDSFSSSDSGAKFHISPANWNAETEVGMIREFSIHGKSNPNEEAPRLKSLSVNDGPTLNCISSFETTYSLNIQANVVDRPQWPKKIIGIYVLLADNDEEGFENDSDSWTPELFEWQQKAANVLFFTFIHPETMDVPPAFQKLASTRGSSSPGSVPSDAIIIFAIGGYSYSINPNPWDWLTTKEKAESMAVKVAEWPDKYGCDGIDLDLEEGAGNHAEAGPNMIHFVKKLKELSPGIIISQPTYGYPQVRAEIDVINGSWDEKGTSKGIADSIGLMVYEGTQALSYVNNYANGTSQWEGFPIKVNVPKSSILLGAKGSTSSSNIVKLAQASLDQDLLGIMVWYSSVKNGFQYAPYWDASDKPDSVQGYEKAREMFKN
ncbi:uncharacterized protein [Lepeophtheirus salmonis]|uniref:uncharacterized protein n=1 Tax=Lepeophtheirus salmonis TaxID=72036 RepID=UPI001AE29ED1|nr:uncharacterized protein LOC121117404 [Lepeophtheirus salmonis]